MTPEERARAVLRRIREKQASRHRILERDWIREIAAEVEAAIAENK